MRTKSETYTLIAEQAGDGGWGVHAVELPGVVALGPTRDEALSAWDEALALHAEAGPIVPREDVFVERRTVTRPG